MFDSVFSPRHSGIFAKDNDPLILESFKDLDKVESRIASIMEDEIAKEIRRFFQEGKKAVDNESSEAIAALDWNLGVKLQPAIFSIWDEGWEMGMGSGASELTRLIKRLQRFSSLDDVLGEVEKLPILTVKNHPAAAKVLQRVIELAGNFASDTLDRLKQDLFAAIQPQEDTGKPISRETLISRIQRTLDISQNRAQLIARTELTNAYNQGRLETYNRISDVTHVKFISIVDDRTSPICLARNGMVIPLSDTQTIDENAPPLHGNCRSVYSPLLPDVIPEHQKIIDNPKNQWQNKELPKPWA